MHLLSLASMKNKALVALVTICIAIFGGVALASLKTELTPELELPAVVVTTTMPGASPDIVSADVTAPIERAVQSVPGLEGTSGTSSTGSSVVFAEFEYGISIPTTEQRVQQAVNRIAAQLPEGAEPTVLTGSIADFPSSAYAEWAALPRNRRITRCDPFAPLASVLSVGSPFTR